MTTHDECRLNPTQLIFSLSKKKYVYFEKVIRHGKNQVLKNNDMKARLIALEGLIRRKTSSSENTSTYSSRKKRTAKPSAVRYHVWKFQIFININEELTDLYAIIREKMSYAEFRNQIRLYESIFNLKYSRNCTVCVVLRTNKDKLASFLDKFGSM